MREPTSEFLLLRVLVAVAWADGVLEADELRFINGLASEYGLDDHERAEIDHLLENPVSIEDYGEYARAFLRQGSPDDRVRLIARAERIMEADEVRHAEEIRYLHLLKRWMEEQPVATEPAEVAPPLLGRIGRLFKKANPSALGATVRSLVGSEGKEVSVREAYVALFGALLYRVIYADRVVDAGEVDRLRNVLAERFQFEGGEADYIIRLIQQRVAEDHDRQRLCAEFNRLTDLADRITLLEALFETAASDGEVSAEEEAEVRLISNYLWIEVQDFVAARRKVLGR